jgi:ankyrin repeat protein
MDKEEATEQLYRAVKAGDHDAAEAAIDAGANIDLKATLFQTPLHLAAAFGHTDVAKLLIERGADINARNALDKTPLDSAVHFGHDDIVDLLKNAAKQQLRHAARVRDERKDKGPPQVGG